jgi:hypothetical protein
MHRSASFARARFTITKSDWPAINLGRKPLSVGIPRRNLQLREGIGEVRKCLAAGPCSPKEAERAWRYAILAIQTKQRNPSAGQRGFAFLQHSASALRTSAYGVPWSARLIRGPGGRLWLRRTAPQPNPQREANQLAASWRPLDLAGQPRLRSAASKTSWCRSAG